MLAGYQGTERPVYTWDVNRPGLALSGYLDYFANDRVQILGNTEIHFMERMSPASLAKVMANMFAFEIPVFVLSRNLVPQPVFLDMCNRSGIPVLRTAMSTDEVISRIILFLSEEFAPETVLHGTAVDVYGVGCLIVGKPGIGKSESALELIERGHRLIADDLVELKRRREDYLYAQTNKIVRHHMEIRGLGIVDVRPVFGAGSVRISNAWPVVELEEWDDKAHYDRTGLSGNFVEILGVRIPYLRILSGREEYRDHYRSGRPGPRLKEMGVSSARQLTRKLPPETGTANDRVSGCSPQSWLSASGRKKKRSTVRERDWDVSQDAAFSHDLSRHRRALAKLPEHSPYTSVVPDAANTNAVIVSHSRKWAFVEVDPGCNLLGPEGEDTGLCLIDERLRGRGIAACAGGPGGGRDRG